MTFRPCPKPQPREKKPPKRLPRNRAPIARAWLKHGTKPIPTVNRKATARRAKKYRTVLASDFHKRLRYDACQRSKGLCECDACRALRLIHMTQDVRFTPEMERAWTRIPVYFTNRGGEGYKRFRSKDGELHHDSYKFFGDENPAELQHVRWVHKSCHQRIESEHGTRRRFLKGR